MMSKFCKNSLICRLASAKLYKLDEVLIATSVVKCENSRNFIILASLKHNSLFTLFNQPVGGLVSSRASKTIRENLRKTKEVLGHECDIVTEDWPEWDKEQLGK